MNGWGLGNLTLDWNLVISFVWQILFYLAIFAVIYAIASAMRRRLLKPHELGLAWPKWSELGFGVIGAVIYYIAAALVLALAQRLLTGVNWEQSQEIGLPSFLLGLNLLVSFLFLGVIVPFLEEITFRGLLFGRLRTKLGWILSATITSVIFALVHGQWNVAIDVFVLSMISCGVRELTGNINASILIHMIKNTLAFYLLFVA